MPIAENLEIIKENIGKACQRSGRNEKDIKLLAVTKTVNTEAILEAIELGIKDVGENKVQELLAKYPEISSKADIHFIGQLQTNKVKYILDKVCLIHSVDRYQLAEEISKRSIKLGIKSDILIEVNIGLESSKAGILPQEDEMLKFVQQLQGLSGVKIKGLMTIAPNIDDDKQLRAYFAKMYKLYQWLQKELGSDCDVLSMGMSNDYIPAIEEGSTLIRLGTALFGARQANK